MVTSISYDGKLVHTEKTFFMQVDILPLLHHITLERAHAILGTGATINHDEADDDPIAVDHLSIHFETDTPQELVACMKRLMEVLPPEAYEHVKYGFFKDITPTPALTELLETHRRAQGLNLEEKNIRDKGLDALLMNGELPILSMTHRLPNHQAINLTLTPRGGKEVPSHHLGGYCHWDMYRNKEYAMFDEVTSSQMARILRKTYEHAMAAQEGRGR